MTELFQTNSVEAGQSASPRPNKTKKRIVSAIVLLVTVFLVSFTASVVWPKVSDIFTGTEIADYEGSGTNPVVVTIPEGATGTKIGEVLHEADVVKSSEAFVEAFKANPRAQSIMPGSYLLNSKQSGVSAVAALLDPASRAENTVTIPEGFTKAQVFARIENVLGIPLADVEAAAKSSEIGLPAEANGDIEGWISPLTYKFEPNATAEDVLKTMVAARLKDMESLNISRSDWQRTLIVASIVQREVNWPDHYGKVARVIENRLLPGSESNGLLQMDSTVLYGVGKTGGIPTADELAADNPYNTYKHTGLPPTPISNPSFEVLAATVNPPAGDWLYFVTVNLDSGETKFAKTLAEHNKNVAEFRAWVEENR